MIDLARARAHWITRETIALPAEVLPYGTAAEDLTWSLAGAPEGGLDPHRPGELVALELGDGTLPSRLADRWPHLGHCHPVHLRPETLRRVPELLTGQVALLGHQRRTGQLLLATSLQVPGVLDEVYAAAADRELGITWTQGDPARVPTLTVWAPTARSVELLLWEDRPPEVGTLAWSPPAGEEPLTVPMHRADDGTWSVTGTPAWRDRCYRYQLTHVLPRLGERRTITSTDPWSVGLTIDSTHSVILDLDDPELAPQQWRAAPVPERIRPVDQTIYELHVRDFSRDDPDLPPEIRGSYLAFGPQGARGAGQRHLRALAQAGLTTVHLLPTFDISTIPEDRIDRQDHPARRHLGQPGHPPAAHPSRQLLAALPPDSEEQQRLITGSAARDAFNWGYDPWHFMTPEGSYTSTARAAHGAARVVQFRELVGGLHTLGLRVVLDQVLNHTADSGLARASVLDRIVPGYYHRLDAEGFVETSTCCQNLATEHLMGHKLMVDTCVQWVRHYRVDGFRFDLMGHHSRANLEAVREALDALTVQRDGVDGSAVLLYGEGWDFGEVAGNARFHQATQGQLAGTQVGTFNDRIRDAVRGGSVHDSDPRTGLGFATGGTDPWHTDLLQVALAGGLRTVQLRSQASGEQVTGEQVRYGQGPGGYAEEPAEVVNYVDAHDNETLWDTLVLKLAPGTPMAERIRRNTLALATVTWSQSASFWHAGAEILRSKSLDRNSYNSGDWFNHLDLTLRENGFGRGLPPAPDNQDRWPIMAPLLADPALRPSTQDMAHARDCALDLLRVRAGHPLLRLGSAEEIHARVSFPVSGTGQGRSDLVVMLIDGSTRPGQDPPEPGVGGLLVVLNGSAEARRTPVPGLTGQHWELVPELRRGADTHLLATGWDAAAGAVRVPALSAIVLQTPSGLAR